jgi:acyl-coenzyme A thioesterase PaaI-like protein
MAIPTDLLERDQAASIDLHVIYGDTLRFQGTVEVDGVVQNLTGCNARAKIKATDAGSVTATFTSTVPTPAAGLVLCLLAPAATTAAALGTVAADGDQVGVWDLEIYDGTDAITVARGNVYAYFERATA